MCKVAVYNFVQGLFVYWEAVKMAKRNNVVNFASKRRQKGMATKPKKKYQNQTVGGINIKRYKYVARILLVLIVILVGSESIIALKFNVMASLLHYWAEAYKSAFVEIIAILNTILLFIGGIRKDAKKSYFSICIFSIVICVVSAISILELTGLVLEVREQQAAEHSDSSTVIVEVSGEYKKEFYSSREDIFIERLERYYGVEEGSISQEETIDKMVILIEKELRNKVNTHVDTEIPKSYEENCFIANTLYEFYDDNREMLEEDYNDYIITELRENILGNVEKAKYYRKLADRAYEDSTNQRLIGLYCIDLSDDYLRTGDIVSAEVELVSAANWAIKSIITAAVKGNRKQMESALEVLELAEGRLSNLEDEIGDSNIQKVKKCLDAYRIVVDNWEAKQQ